jgi:hypothetical protein
MKKQIPRVARGDKLWVYLFFWGRYGGHECPTPKERKGKRDPRTGLKTGHYIGEKSGPPPSYGGRAEGGRKEREFGEGCFVFVSQP